MRGMHFVYLHGGPGMNSFGEEEILRPLFEERGASIEFWNEPPVTSPGGAFRNLTQSVRERLALLKRGGQPVHVIAHSFGANAACHVLLEEPDLADALTLVAPALHFREELSNILNLALDDFRASSPKVALELEELITTSKSFYDKPMRKAVDLAAQDPNLFNHYFFNKDALARYFGVWGKRGAGLDLNAFHEVTQDYGASLDVSASSRRLSLPTTLVSGSHEAVIDGRKELTTCQNLFSNFSAVEFPSSGHFPHLEEPEKFVSLLLS